MRRSWTAALTFAAVLAALWVIAGPLGSAQAGPSKQDLNRSLSANEKMIQKFEMERNSEIAKGSVENARRIELKIKNLSDENARIRSQLGPSSSAGAKAFGDLIGADWSAMPESERQRFIYTGIGGLERQGVFVTRPPRDYIEAMDRILAQDAEMKTEPLDNLFVFCVYDAEPQTREAIRAIRENAPPAV